MRDGEQRLGEITELLEAARDGAPGAMDALYARIYSELHQIARAKLSALPPITVLDAPALVSEAYLRLVQRGSLPPASNRHLFYGYAASVMRAVIVDCLRERNAAKRGSGERPITLMTRDRAQSLRDPEIDKLNDALLDLEKVDPRCRQIVEMRYFAGMSAEEIADAIKISVATVKREWKKARAFLYDVMQEGG